MKNAEKLELYHSNEIPSQNKPGTMVYKIFKNLFEYLENDYISAQRQ